MSLSIRPLIENDHAQWLSLWQAYLDFFPTTLADEVIQETWRRLVSRPDMQALGAFDEAGNLVGFAHILIHPNTWNIGECCYLEDLFVDSAHRRQGIARQLIEAVYAAAEARNCNRVYWITAAENQTAQALYDQLAAQTGMLQYRKDFA